MNALAVLLPAPLLAAANADGVTPAAGATTAALIAPFGTSFAIGCRDSKRRPALR
jgi:hypothetical protein